MVPQEAIEGFSEIHPTVREQGSQRPEESKLIIESEDRRKFNGGKRNGAGRKIKAFHLKKARKKAAKAQKQHYLERKKLLSPLHSLKLL